MARAPQHATERQAADPPVRAQVAMHLELRSVLAFVALVVLIAANVVAVRLVNRELPPFWGAATRFAVSGLLFGLIMAARRQPFPRGRALAATLIFGALQFGLGFALGYWALQVVPASLGSMILALIPLFTVFIAAAARLETLRVRRVVGAVIALAGIAVLFRQGITGDLAVMRLLAAVASAACFALVGVIIKLYPEVPAATMNAVGMGVGTALLLGLSLATGEIRAGDLAAGANLLPSLPATWWAQAYLVLPGSVGVFGLLLYLLGRWTASAVSYQTVLAPPVAILLSLWLLNEPVTGDLALGGALILLGVYAGALAQGERQPVADRSSRR